MMIIDNIHRVQQQIADACARTGRDPQDVTLIAVSKTHPAEMVLAAVSAGLQHFGENRVEESESKIPVVNAKTAQPLVWHMIGHIQSRKAREVVPLFNVVHSVDTLKLASRLASFSAEQGRTLDVLLEVNVSGEAAKHGFAAAGWEDNADLRQPLFQEFARILHLPGLRVRGLMTMAPIVDQMEQVRPVFRSLRRLRDALQTELGQPLPELSMGMTDDFPVAIEEGATFVRVGRAIFGDRE
ncbi:MAG: YggS family pyridoxal phosphate-dependent enzyme [Anaerolineae bacterium]|mgnify:CR=1 FL=1|nr:YggS family pyridoxal phosphate-dependent enzyme [Anaerolineae bacterium]MBN8618674.1 YggS family pyridoxal phosphate-dependent enzyme [Anaerolineae bacterium]